MTEITIHTGPHAHDLIHLDWFNRNNVRQETLIAIEGDELDAVDARLRIRINGLAVADVVAFESDDDIDYSDHWPKAVYPLATSKRFRKLVCENSDFFGNPPAGKTIEDVVADKLESLISQATRTTEGEPEPDDDISDMSYVPVRPEHYQRLSNLVKQNPAYFGTGDKTPLELAIIAMEVHIESLKESKPGYSLVEIEDAFYLYLQQVNAWDQIKLQDQIILRMHHWGVFQDWLEDGPGGQRANRPAPDKAIPPQDWGHMPPGECCPTCSTPQNWVRHFGGCPHEGKQKSRPDGGS